MCRANASRSADFASFELHTFVCSVDFMNAFKRVIIINDLHSFITLISLFTAATVGDWLLIQRHAVASIFATGQKKRNCCILLEIGCNTSVATTPS